MILFNSYIIFTENLLPLVYRWKTEFEWCQATVSGIMTDKVSSEVWTHAVWPEKYFKFHVFCSKMSQDIF